LRIAPDGSLHLTYCTNIHAADGWPAVFDALERHAPALKRRFAPGDPFGVGLRLSARDARELLAAGVDTFRAFLDDRGLYVAIINGFPHGSFHRSVVKADVYAPDWRDPERVRYTRDLIRILAGLLPTGMDGGVSTVPLSYKAWMPAEGGRDGELDRALIVRHLVEAAATLADLRAREGTLIHLDIEPEPDCVLETTAETVSFFRDRLFEDGARALAEAIGGTRDEAGAILREHVRVCFDCCHFAVEHEDPVRALRTLTAAGCRIGRIQLSSALRVHMPAAPGGQQHLADRLRPFADSTYLHQVVCEGPGGRARFPDLGDALAHAQPGDWRIHFHVPLFTSEYDGLGSTQADVARVLAEVVATPVTRHLEIETYTWEVLPDRLKVELLESIAREYDWVLASVANPFGAGAAG
jgi:sugar phosphate isomerase/epimerase